MGIKINDIVAGSLVSRLPIKVGDVIHSIDGEPVYDILDWLFLSQQDSFEVEYSDAAGAFHSCRVVNTFENALGIEVDLSAPCECVNACIFCFVDQMPLGLRDTLYVKDDDFIYSFFYGNFITLTNLSEKEIAKIIHQHISPLYVSVHTTNPALHKSVLGYERDFDVLDVLQRLNDAGIEIHSQIVLLPEINDRAELFKTLSDLLEMEYVATIGVVPVGLTCHRESVYPLRKMTQGEALETIREIEFLKQMRGVGHIQCADELYFLAQLPIPDDAYYADYEQIENGIGMVRKSWENWKYSKRKVCNFLNKLSGNPVFVTSVSGMQAIESIVRDIQKRLADKAIRVAVIENEFFGSDVSVTGLLTWSDISRQLQLTDLEYPVFSSNIFNHDMYTIDNIHIDTIVTSLNRDVAVIDELWTEVACSYLRMLL